MILLPACGGLAVVGCATEERSSPTTPAPAVSSAPNASPSPSAVLDEADIWATVRVAEAFDTGSTYEGGGNQYVADPSSLADVVRSSHYAVTARVVDIHPSEINTRSGEFEISEEQRAEGAPRSAVPVPEPRTKIDLEVLDVLGQRPDSPVTPGNEIQVDVKGGAVRLVMSPEAGERLLMFDPDSADDAKSPTSLPPDLVEATIAQSMELGWTEGDEVIVFVAQGDVVLSTFTNGEPDMRRDALRIAIDPVGAFTIRHGTAVSQAEFTTFESLPIDVVVEAAEAMNSEPTPTTLPIGPD